MAKFEMKKVMSIFFMVLLVVAQAEDSSPTSSPSKNSIGDLICIGKCAFECKRFIKNIPLLAGCVIACKLFNCRKVSSKIVYDCATKCSISKAMKVNTDIQGINVIVDSCLEACENK
ncbi:uncharacterized protein LOC127100333 [Lathyrus oleraceus]|uniref:Thionin related (TAP1) n=1 Tax=Pisum sativum TaxID=3888 RepID=A0A9D4VX27_PEA|nr:uncharacterized protein LOC127100333 [Pisum sativum]KAI5391919.1 hypothetical protein KIW84_076643 [Pisum sativum]